MKKNFFCQISDASLQLVERLNLIPSQRKTMTVRLLKKRVNLTMIYTWLTIKICFADNFGKFYFALWREVLFKIF